MDHHSWIVGLYPIPSHAGHVAVEHRRVNGIGSGTAPIPILDTCSAHEGIYFVIKTYWLVTLIAALLAKSFLISPDVKAMGRE